MTQPSRRPPASRLWRDLAAAGLLSLATLGPGVSAGPAFDPLLDSPGRSNCGPVYSGQPALLKALIKVHLLQTRAAHAEAAAAPKPDAVPLYNDLGSLTYAITTKSPRAQAYFNQGLRLAFAFNHAEALRAFQAGQQLDPTCAMCFWGAAYVLGPNINVPFMPEANAPALAAQAEAVKLKDRVSERERALIEALDQRYSADPQADRPLHDGRYADAMRAVAARFPNDDSILSMAAEAAMDTQPWDYWEAAGAKPKGRAEYIVQTLETVLKRNPTHPGAIHLYIHAMEASTQPEKALAPARRLAALTPGAGHLVHMPAHIYYRLGLYKEAMTLNQRAVLVDEHYFGTSPSDPLYKTAYYPHNLHFVMVSAMMGGDAKTALAAATKLDAAMPVEAVKQFAIMQPIKAAPFYAQATFGDPKAVLALPKPADDVLVVKAAYHYARAVALARSGDAAAAQPEIDALAALEKSGDFKPFEPWGVPAKDIVHVALLVAQARQAEARGELDAAAQLYEGAVTTQDALSYTEPPYWYYPVRQSLGALKLRQGKLDEARDVLRESLVRVRNNGWALATLVEVEHKRGDAAAERAARQAYERAWFGPRNPAANGTRVAAR